MKSLRIERSYGVRRRKHAMSSGRSSTAPSTAAGGGGGGRRPGRDAQDRAARTPEGAEAAAEANLKWLRQQKKDNPKLEKVYDDLIQKIKKKFRWMGQDIEVVHGKIYRNRPRRPGATSRTR